MMRLPRLTQLILMLAFAAGQTMAQVPIPEPGQPKRTPSYDEKQGLPKEQSAAMLEPAVRALLDTFLRYYREPGLIANRAKALEALGVQNTTRRWSDEKPLEGSHRAYVDTFAQQGLFARPGWSGESAYRGKIESWLNEWHARISVNVGYKHECINSRAVEGYLDLVLNPGIAGTSHQDPNQIFRHEVPYARPYASPITASTSSISLIFSNGCLSRISAANIFNLKDVKDDEAHN